MIINTAYKFRIYPNKAQATLINKTIGCSRFVFNYFLSLWDNAYQETGKGLTYGTCSAKLPANEIIDVSLSSNDKLVDIAAKLKNIKGRYDEKLPVKIILGLLCEKFIITGENALKIKPFIFKLVHNNCCEGFDYIDEQLYNFNEEINLAADNIYGNLEDISQEIKRFLSVYKDFIIYFHLPYGGLDDE